MNLFFVALRALIFKSLVLISNLLFVALRALILISLVLISNLFFVALRALIFKRLVILILALRAADPVNLFLVTLRANIKK